MEKFSYSLEAAFTSVDIDSNLCYSIFVTRIDLHDVLFTLVSRTPCVCESAGKTHSTAQWSCLWFWLWSWFFGAPFEFRSREKRLS